MPRLKTIGEILLLLTLLLAVIFVVFPLELKAVETAGRWWFGW